MSISYNPEGEDYDMVRGGSGPLLVQDRLNCRLRDNQTSENCQQQPGRNFDDDNVVDFSCSGSRDVGEGKRVAIEHSQCYEDSDVISKTQFTDWYRKLDPALPAFPTDDEMDRIFIRWTKHELKNAFEIANFYIFAFLSAFQNSVFTQFCQQQQKILKYGVLFTNWCLFVKKTYFLSSNGAVLRFL